MTLLNVIHIPHEENRISDYWDLLSLEERSAADRFVRYADKLCYVVTRGYLRKLLGSELNRKPEDIQIEYAPKGKPRLSSDSKELLFFNASHSGAYSVIAINRDCEIGVDIERKREIRDLDGLAARFFTAAEFREFDTAEDKVSCFFSIWTLKEAIVKLTGKGISGGLSGFDVSLDQKSKSHLTRLENSQWKQDEISLEPFEFDANYAAALATASTRMGYSLLRNADLNEALHRA